MSWLARFRGTDFMVRCWLLAIAALYGAAHSVWVDHEPWLSVAGWVTVAACLGLLGWWRR